MIVTKVNKICRGLKESIFSSSRDRCRSKEKMVKEKTDKLKNQLTIY